jgi:membrane protein YdbS with pleckstrin-like domain
VVIVILREPAQMLDPRMRKVWTVEGVITTVVLAVGVSVAVAVLLVADVGRAARIVAVGGAAVVIASAVFLAWLLPLYGHRHFRYEVTELGLYVARGWFWRRWQVVPHARIETVEIRSGPLLRAFGLSSVQVATAAAGGGTRIPGLTSSAADALVQELARHADAQRA